MSGQRPQSIAAVAEWSATWDEFSLHFQDFLHECQARRLQTMLDQRPRLLAELFPGGKVCDAYLVAIAASLAAQLGAPAPGWAKEPDQYLRKPWFASPGPAMRACLLLESPARFRERNLFVTSKVLSVA
jgi:hypothetical protein